MVEDVVYVMIQNPLHNTDTHIKCESLNTCPSHYLNGHAAEVAAIKELKKKRKELLDIYNQVLRDEKAKSKKIKLTAKEREELKKLEKRKSIDILKSKILPKSAVLQQYTEAPLEE